MAATTTRLSAIIAERSRIICRQELNPDYPKLVNYRKFYGKLEQSVAVQVNRPAPYNGFNHFVRMLKIERNPTSARQLQVLLA